jgi:hypothetical protein
MQPNEELFGHQQRTLRPNMKHDLLVLLLLFFGLSGIVQTSGVNEKQSKHRFPLLSHDRSSNRSFNRMLSAFAKEMYSGFHNEVIFNSENAVTRRFKSVVCMLFKENVEHSTTIYKLLTS